MARRQALRSVTDSGGVCSARPMRRSTLTATLRGSEGLGLVEVMAVTVIVGIAVIGVALMFGKGSAWVSAVGADRVAAGLAQQRIEQIRACGWGKATSVLPPEGEPIPPEKLCPSPFVTGLGRVISDPSIDARGEIVQAGELGKGHTFTRTVCIQYVDPTTSAGLNLPAYTPLTCPAGAATAAIRATVVVRSARPETSPVTLQAWMTETGP